MISIGLCLGLNFFGSKLPYDLELPQKDLPPLPHKDLLPRDILCNVSPNNYLYMDYVHILVF